MTTVLIISAVWGGLLVGLVALLSINHKQETTELVQILEDHAVEQAQMQDETFKRVLRDTMNRIQDPPSAVAMSFVPDGPQAEASYVDEARELALQQGVNSDGHVIASED